MEYDYCGDCGYLPVDCTCTKYYAINGVIKCAICNERPIETLKLCCECQDCGVLLIQKISPVYADAAQAVILESALPVENTGFNIHAAHRAYVKDSIEDEKVEKYRDWRFDERIK